MPAIPDVLAIGGVISSRTYTIEPMNVVFFNNYYFSKQGGEKSLAIIRFHHKFYINIIVCLNDKFEC